MEMFGIKWNQAAFYICLVRTKLEDNLYVWTWGCVDRSPGILERRLLMDLTPLLDTRHVADAPLG